MSIYPPTGTLEIKDATLKIPVVDLQYTSNTAKLEANSNVVTEFSRSKKLIKYPRVLLTSAALNSAYENGYRVTFSSENTSYRAYHPFSLDENSAVGWHSNNGTTGLPYDGTGGLYGTSGTAQLAAETERGEWLGLELPVAIKLERLRMVSQDYSPAVNTIDDFIVYAKKQSGDTWTNIGTFTGIAPLQNSAAGAMFDVNAVEYYKFFAIVATKRDAAAAGSGVSIRVLEYFGVPEYDPDADGTDVTVKSLPNVPNTDWLKVYYDAKDLTNVSSPISDLSGNSVNGAVNGNINVSDGAFVFDGVGDTITGTVPGVSGDYAHTVTMWIKFNDIHADIHGDTFFEMGERSGNKIIGLYAHPNKFHYYFFNNDHHYNYTVTNGVWYHVTATYSGGDSVNGRKLYINGTAITRTITGGGGTYALANGNFTLGGLMTGHTFGDTYSFKGSIANFRFFDRALTTDEIYQLYAYQKEYFGHSTNNLTLKAGRLGIGTSEPRAALDVRGDIFGPGIIQVQSTTFNGTASGTGTSFTTLSGLTTSITPKRTGSKILILLNLFWSGSDDAYFQGNVKKDGTVLVKQEGSVGSASKTTFGAFGSYNRGIYALKNVGFSYLDDTNIGTEPIEYTIEVRNRALTAANYMDWWINYTSSTNDANRLTAVSTLTLIEIQQ